MRAHGQISVEDDRGRPVLASSRCEPPFAIRRSGRRILVASSAAAPVGGDALSLDIDVGPDAHADVGTVAATLVLPGPSGAASTMTTRCVVDAGGRLDWRAEPTISVRDSIHTIVTTVDLHRSATCRIVEEVSLGRVGEESGLLRVVLRVVRDARPVVHHDERFGPTVPGTRSVVSVADGHHVLSAVLVGVDAGDERVTIDGEVRAAWLPLSGDTAMVLAVGPDRPGVVEVVTALAPELIASPSTCGSTRSPVSDAS